MTDHPAAGSVPSVPLPTGDPGAWPVGRALLTTLLVFGGGQLLGLALLQAGSGWLLGWGALLDPGAIGRLSTRAQQWLVIGIQLFITVAELVLVWMIANRDGERREVLSLRWPAYRPVDWIRVIALVFGVKIAASAVILPFAGEGSTAKDLKPFIELAKDNGLWLAFLAAAVIGAVVEEFVFRAILSRSLEATRLGVWGGAATASAIFAVVHLQYGFAGQLVVFALGMAFALLRSTSGSIWPGVVTHALNNAVALLAMKVVA